MMKNRWLAVLLLTTSFLCLPSLSSAIPIWVDDPMNYSVMSYGVNSVKIKVPVYNKDGYDTWIDWGYIYYQEEGSDTKTKLLYWAVTEENISSDASSVGAKFSSDAGGQLKLLRGSLGETISSDEKQYNLFFNGALNVYAEVEWTVPLELRGKNLNISWDVQRDGNSRYETKVELYDTRVAIPEKTGLMDPMITAAFISNDGDNAGQLIVPWLIAVQDDDIVSSVARFKDGNGAWREMTLETKASGYIYVDATVPHDSLHVVVNYISRDKEGDEGDLIEGRTSSYYNVPMIHRPSGLTATPVDDGKATVKLEWKVENKDNEDYMEGDNFQLQRSLSGEEEDFVDIATVRYIQGQESYSYEDATFLASLQNTDIGADGFIKPVYRIRRSLSAVWGWSSNPLVDTHEAKLPILKLYSPRNATGDWEDEDNHTVKVKWEYESGSSASWVVWDERAQMRLEVRMYRRDGTLADSVAYVLTPDEVREKTKVITLSRSCVNYDISLVTDDTNSPVKSGFKYLEIATTEDFLRLVNDYKDAQVYVKQTRDIMVPQRGTPSPYNVISYSNMEQDLDWNFTGVYDGNGYSLILPEYIVSLFTNIHDATIKNVTLQGMNGNRRRNRYGWACFAYDAKNTLFENCMVKTFTHAENHFMAGFALSGDHLTFKNCVYAGQLSNTANYVKNKFRGFINECNDPQSIVYDHAVYAPYHEYIGEVPFSVVPDNVNLGDYFKTAYVLPKDRDEATYDAGRYNILPGDRAEQLQILGSGFTEAEDYPYFKPVVNSSAFETTHVSRLKVQIPDFYFESNGRVSPNSLTTETRQSSVMLTWEVEGGVVDYFQVRRRIKGEQDWETIATVFNELGYEDTTASPIVESYEYMVRSAVDCEGTSFKETNIVEGHCMNTGMVDGYVRYKDGTGVPGITVVVTTEKDGQPHYAETDDTGYYVVDLLSYFGGTSIDYVVTPIGFEGGKKGIDLEETHKSSQITFDDRHNYFKVADFVVTSSVKFAGTVLYEGTRIPVKGVHFQVNGYEVHASSGNPVETDSEGNFEFHVFKGLNKIQAVMDGHTFWQNGWFKGEEGRRNGYDISGNVSSIFFYDNTKVKLIGRIAGGNDQGAIPLDNSLSKNNLGDSIVMVLTLEGDNKSSLVYDNLNPLKETVENVFTHPSHDKAHVYQTRMITKRRSITILPDTVTGEYSVMLPPVRFKVQQIYATGYSTLFPDGKSSDVIDLTEALTTIHETYEGEWINHEGAEVTQVSVDYNAKYNRIWHAPTELSYKQLGFNQFGFFGDETYMCTTLGGEKCKVPLAYMKDPEGPKTEDNVAYTFGYPVFSIERQYPFQLSAVEKYYWNNNHESDNIDVVHLKGGKVTIHNGFTGSSTAPQEVLLDSLGQALVPIMAKQVPYLLTKKDALRTLTMTLTMDGTTFEAKPLHAYVMNIFDLPGASDILSVGTPVLVDILRDPPGGGSFAKLSRGATLKKEYKLEMEAKLGVKMNFWSGSSFSYSTGTVLAPGGGGAYYGIDYEGQQDWEFNYDAVINVKGERAFSYTMTTKHDITTSSDPKMVGADADIYMGFNQDMILRPSTAIRAIPHSQYIQMGGRFASGSSILIAEGKAQNDSLFYLVRDEVVSTSQKINSTFTYTQSHIINVILPALVKQCKNLLFIGTQNEAQELANKTKQLVYLSLRDPDDPKFGVMNTDVSGYVSYSSIDPDKDDMNYRIIVPQGYGNEVIRDSIYQLNQTIYAWIDMIARNEKAKFDATELVNNFDVDGGVGLEYSESFESEYSNQTSWFVPILSSIMHPYFSGGAGRIGEAVTDVLDPFVQAMLSSLDWNWTGKSDDWSNQTEQKKNGYEITINFTGSLMMLKLEPVFSYETNHYTTESRNFSREESFTISLDKKSHLNVGVYRANTIMPEDVATSDLDVFSSEKFYNNVDFNNGFLDRDLNPSKWLYPTSFVYRTNGGATCRPYEGERKSIFYMGGQTLDKRTKQIEKPVIRLDKQSVSGVPYGEPARFKVYMTNESEEPESAYPVLNLSLDDQSNPYGARLTVDGFPVTWAGTEIGVTPGNVTEKTLEVYAGEGFDYEGITLNLMSCEDVTAMDQVSFDVHYLHTAGPVNISSPGDKWVMNTESPYDKRGYHIPVTIDGFNKNQHNFDHIEFQYKESARGEDYWTNLCSFYENDTLYNEASGVKAMIPENGVINTEFFGGEEIIEKAFDLRAVLFCRNGNEFLTTSSKVLSGIKDTRRPQLFGTPEPVSGILDIGDNIVFNFSEDIEYNYLSNVGNFEVKGEVNNDAIVNDVSVYFDGKSNASMETEAQRNFNDKELTVQMFIKPDGTNTEMPLFSHGTSGKKLQLWLTEKKHLKVVVNGDTFETEEEITPFGFTQVAMVLTRPGEDDEDQAWHVALYNGGAQLGRYALTEPYTGNGPLIFGRTNETNRKKSKYYSGRMMEVRLWYRALTPGQLATIYGEKRLTGYEMGLVDYFPMNEGMGEYALDKSQGANAKLYNTAWAMPHGMSLHLEWEDRGMALSKDAFSRTSEEDYTIMFWFRTDTNGRGVLLSNGAGLASNIGAQSQFCIGFEAEKLMFRSNGMAVQAIGNYSDNDWHHYAMTVNRAMNVGCIYVDGVLRANFATEGLGGISGGHPMLGGALYEEIRDGKPVLLDNRNWLRGNLDEICMFAQALPLSLIQSFMTKSPSGEEAGLIAYLSFDRQERQQDNSIEYVPYVYSRKIKKDDDGNIIYELDRETQKPTTVPAHDYLFDESVTEQMVLDHIDKNLAAPMRPYEELQNLNFSFSGRNNQILVNINEMKPTINKRNVYVTLREIPDKNGNMMASPVTATYFIDCSPLRWLEKKMHEHAEYGKDESIYLGIVNNSGVKHTYTIENCPKWLTFDKYSNVVLANDSEFLTATISKNLNVGTYDEVLYLTDEDGMAEPLYLTVTVEGDAPNWMVSGNLLQHNMNIIGEVTVNDEIDIDTRDIVGVFDKDNVCHGVAHIDYSELTGESRVYLTVYDKAHEDDSDGNKQLYFKLWRYSTGLEMLLNVTPSVTFVPSAVVGADKPVSMKAGLEYVQTFDLKEGWNWVSFNVSSENLFNLNTLLDELPWENGDILTDMNSNMTLVYKDNHWRLSGDMSSLGLSPKRAYAVKVQNDIKFPIAGAIIKQKDTRTITLKKGWNGIGYTPMMNLSVETALADYHSKAQEGDVIKSHDEFAVYTVTNNVGRWKGSLQYMKPGEGYMLLRKDATSASFTYPFYEPGSTFLDEGTNTSAWNVAPYMPATMSLSAVACGVEMQQGDRLMAYADGELRGVAENSTDSVFYMSVAGDVKQPLYFAIEREGEIIATTGEILLFESNAVMGTPDAPTRIDFTRRDIPQHGWYTIDGIRLQTRPVKKGVYIYNGQKRVVD